MQDLQADNMRGPGSGTADGLVYSRMNPQRVEQTRAATVASAKAEADDTSTRPGAFDGAIWFC